jgi:hypothetical protein
VTKIRAKANRNIVDVDERRAKSLVNAGIFEYVESEVTRTRRTRRAELVVEHAAEAAEAEAEQEPEPEPETPEPVDYESQTKDELTELAEGLEVDGTGKDGYITKADLVRALRYRRRDLRAEE